MDDDERSGGRTGAADAGLSARAAQLLYAYARAVDEGDLDALAEMAAEDIAVTRENGTRRGREEFLALYRGFRDSPVLRSKHLVTNVQAFPEEGGLIRAKAYFSATMFDPDGARVVVGQYTDSMREDSTGLRFVHKRILVDGVIPLAAAQEWTGVAPKPA